MWAGEGCIAYGPTGRPTQATDANLDSVSGTGARHRMARSGFASPGGWSETRLRSASLGRAGPGKPSQPHALAHVGPVRPPPAVRCPTRMVWARSALRSAWPNWTPGRRPRGAIPRSFSASHGHSTREKTRKRVLTLRYEVTVAIRDRERAVTHFGTQATPHSGFGC